MFRSFSASEATTDILPTTDLLNLGHHAQFGIAMKARFHFSDGRSDLYQIFWALANLGKLYQTGYESFRSDPVMLRSADGGTRLKVCIVYLDYCWL